MDALKNMLSPLGMNTNALQDTLKLVVIGGTVETARRISVSAWNGFVDSFFLTAHFSQEDYPYDWLMHWLSKQPAWGRSREFEITTRTVSRSGITQSTTGDLDEEDVDEDEDALIHGRKKRKVAFIPSLDTTHTIYYRGHWLRITRTKRYPDYGHGAALKISVVARSNDILKKLVLEAKREYEKDAEHRVHIFMADTTYACWRWNGARQKRPLSSIVLQPGVKDMLLADCKDFLASEDCVTTLCCVHSKPCLGIPFRRGYLLHGVPGSGKTSLIHSLAGELGLDIYVVSLSSKGMSDNTLTTLMSHVPSRCILLLEDLDAAFTRSVSRDSSSTGVPLGGTTTTNNESDGSTLSLSGLLNSLDGVAAAEGRLLFATTNHIERLDPALSRPGRMDVWVNFTHATRWQAEGIFKCFFPSKPKNPPVDSAETSSPADEKTDVSQKNLPVPKRKASGHTIPVLEEAEIAELAKRFADTIPENELSVASLQGYLLKNKLRPRECVDEVSEWYLEEKEIKEKLEKKERAKAKKAHRVEASLKLDGANSSTSNTITLPAVVAGVKCESSSSSSESDSSNGGIEADTEESITSEEELEKPIGGSINVVTKEVGKEKWVAVKGQLEASD
ncbi:P-loop containing nucleoside triphosphate hydrolase protein [Pisolithus orientalis]|uniref:P-loop containing nucleoside triphosphate hydrolase protein n=1 Tax=Pisolithus orientalis TaxID=936130 RepID=UPI0022240E10|nr:P-loop containing nucleoside triphosphate hydrolase protein [Pisolithus orientalis]KAI6006663.1 P-loop containing nucleoside triphosphate hydrolase protein [Pisolithus orientalis]